MHTKMLSIFDVHVPGDIQVARQPHKTALSQNEQYCCSTSANTAGLKEIENRKLLSSLKDKKTNFKSILHGSSSSQNGEKSLSWELRKVPSGPDPLHHNGGNPIKPRTP
ncbi:hypothetical protein L6164_018906 [Bauhinia variegata]|uniref:Uncharacterized protein n=1 Tax=Bauhinia variegata TaxID=167791 RepID=A0ACB9NE38_BAUVA|nr:hypothetical protein L6164_018906 [Bauhinia variegata]